MSTYQSINPKHVRRKNVYWIFASVALRAYWYALNVMSHRGKIFSLSVFLHFIWYIRIDSSQQHIFSLNGMFSMLTYTQGNRKLKWKINVTISIQQDVIGEMLCKVCHNLNFLETRSYRGDCIDLFCRWQTL